MNFSMMFRKWILLVGIWVFSLFGVQANTYATNKEVFPKESGEILLVYEKNLDETSKRNIECLVNIASAMGKIIDYGDTQASLTVMKKYNYIICYDLSSTDTTFLRELQKSKANKFIIGSSFMEDYLEQKNQQNLMIGPKMQEKGKLYYSFSENQNYEELITVEKGRVFQNKKYHSGTIQIGSQECPYCYDVSDVRFIPITDLQGGLTKIAFMQELQQWLWPYQDSPPDYAQYIVLDEVYPFMPSEDLLETVEQMIDEEIPFVISVMPLIEHGDYPAMKQFCQVLAYAQKHNGIIILHAPIIHKKVEDIDELYEKLTDMTMSYVENGVYPLGIQVPISWTNDALYQEVLKRYSTVFIYDDGKPSAFDIHQHTNNFCRQGHHQIWPILQIDDSGASKLRCYSSATYMNISSEKEKLETVLENIKYSSNPFMNLWNLDHSVWMNDFVMSYQNQLLYLNGEYTEITYTLNNYQVNYDFKRSALQKISINLQDQNRVLMMIVAIVMVTFAGFIVYARVRIRKIFLGKKNSKIDNKKDQKIEL